MSDQDLTSIKQIVAGVGFGDWTDSILHTAGRLASAYGAKLQVVYADTFEPPVYVVSERARREVDAHRDAATEFLEKRVRDVLGDAPHIAASLVERKPAEAILKTVSDLDADMIVLGAHRRAGLRRMMMGAVPEAVLRKTGVPLLTVRGDVGTDSAPFKRFLCPVNFNRTTQDAVALASDLAKRFEAEVTVMSCLEAGDEGTRSEDDVRRDLHALVTENGASVQDVGPVVRRGDAAREILRAASEGNYDLIVIGAEHKPLLEATVFGTTGVNVMRHAKCSVLSIVRFPD